MALVIKQFINFYNEEQDGRSDDWFLVDSPLLTTVIVISYLYFVKSWGPKFMEKRQPFNIDNILIVYNIVQIAVCMYLVIFGFDTVWNKYKWGCAEVMKDAHGDYVANLVYIYFLLKVTDLLDTVFFVLRKKQNQVTFLHVYHHFGMVVLTFFGVKFVPGGHSIFMGYVNCIVHVCMYLYYLVTAYNKKFKKNLWVKRRITELQLIQFFVLAIWYIQILFRPNCGYPKYVSFVFVPQNAFMCFLFGDFYIKQYILAGKKKPVESKEEITPVEPPKDTFQAESYLIKTIGNKEKIS